MSSNVDRGRNDEYFKPVHERFLRDMSGRERRGELPLGFDPVHPWVSSLFQQIITTGSAIATGSTKSALFGTRFILFMRCRPEVEVYLYLAESKVARP